MIFCLSLLLAAFSVQSKPFSTDPRPLSVVMAESEMKRNPQPYLIDAKGTTPSWNYTTGLELLSILDAEARYTDSSKVDYVIRYADTMVRGDGTIINYKPQQYNIDHVCPGRVLLRAYEMTGEKRYRKALQLVREQLDTHPRTSGGGLWHKQVYPHQMWLDGLYMGQPFYAEYTRRFTKEPERTRCFEDIMNQFIVVARHTYDPATGLYRHAWDESRSQPWADKTTGQSQHVWGRALGWYCMAIVETLDYIPESTKGRNEVIEILRGIYRQLPKYSDPNTGMWYQVLELPDREGNYIEATASAMLTYSMLKAVRKGYLDRELLPGALKTYENLVRTFVRFDDEGTVSLTRCCAVAGLGGKDNRSGTFEYYMSEPIRDNDPKGVGPFIWASLEYEAVNNIDYRPAVDASRAVAFPGAEGGGMYATGGRGGRVIKVTSLADDGSEGTLRHAVEQKGSRMVVFAVSGNIALTRPLEITEGDLTIAGQSAPGEGVCIKDYEMKLEADNIIVRFMRFRMGDLSRNQSDTFEGQRCSNIIIDHCTVSWSTDECASFYGMRDFTMQWCLISESLNDSAHAKGRHGYGAIWGGRNATFHHNLFAHNSSRNPRLDHPRIYPGNSLVTHRGSVEIVNNVIYNWGMQATYGGEEGWWNIVGNYYKPGPASRRNGKFMEVSTSDITSHYAGRYYLKDNFLDGSPGVGADNWSGVTYKGDYDRQRVKVAEPYEVSGTLAVSPPQQAYEAVLAHCGASLRRDAIDRRIIDEVRSGSYTYKGSKGGAPGIIDSQNDVGGWVALAGGKVAKDSDGDGIPDTWEKSNRLNPADPADATAYAKGTHYTNLELYLNSLITGQVHL